MGSRENVVGTALPTIGTPHLLCSLKSSDFAVLGRTGCGRYRSLHINPPRGAHSAPRPRQAEKEKTP